MKLMTKELAKTIPAIGDQREVEDPIAYAKIFNPYGAGTWFITEFNPETKECYGYVELLDSESGFFDFTELESLRVPYIRGQRPVAKLERDLYFSPTPLSQIRNR